MRDPIADTSTINIYTKKLKLIKTIKIEESGEYYYFYQGGSIVLDKNNNFIRSIQLSNGFYADKSGYIYRTTIYDYNGSKLGVKDDVFFVDTL